MSKPDRTRRFPGPQVWALAQDAYLRGESAGDIARRLDLTVNGIRKRATRKGWTRAQHAEAMKRIEHPGQALKALIAEIGRAAAEGRFGDVTGLVRTATHLTRAVHAAPPPPPTEPSPEDKAAWRKAERARLETEYGERARRMAMDLLSERGHPYADGWAASAFLWRAEHLGPEQAALDHAQALRGGWASRYWTPEGRLRGVAPEDANAVEAPQAEKAPPGPRMMRL